MIAIVWNAIFSPALAIDAVWEKSVIQMYMLIRV